MYLDNDRAARRSPRSSRCAWRSSAASRSWPFAVIFFRLWYLQVLSGDHYLAEANDNRVREIKVQAPRGEIVDREGRVLVDNRTGLAVKVTPDKLPEDVASAGAALPRASASVLRRSPQRIERAGGAPAQGAAVLDRHGEAGRRR